MRAFLGAYHGIAGCPRFAVLPTASASLWQVANACTLSDIAG